MCCMPLQVRSAALRRIYMHNLRKGVTYAPLPHETTVSILFRRPAENQTRKIGAPISLQSAQTLVFILDVSLIPTSKSSDGIKS